MRRTPSRPPRASSAALPGLGAARVRLTPGEDAALLSVARSRAGWAFVGLASALALLTFRAGWVMGVPDERLEARGREQFRFAVDVRGRRGSILDREGRLLAATVNLPSLYANPSKLPAAELAARVAPIAALTGRPEAWIRGRHGR